MTQKKWTTRKEAWDMAEKLSRLPHIGSIEEVAKLIGCAVSTVYRWRDTDGNGRLPTPLYTIPLKELAIKEGLLKA